MYLVDSHTHIYSEEFQGDIQEIINRALESGVKKLCLPNINIDSIEPLFSLCEQYPDHCFPMMGLHPTDIKTNYKEDLALIYSQFEKKKQIAVGEIGIDLYWDQTFINEQIDAFEEQLRWSIDLDLPVAIHTREAFPEVFRSLRRIGENRLRGVFHSFSGSEKNLEEALSFNNFLLGINGVITYKKADFKHYLNKAPLDRIVLETDAPYLTPVPFRGKRNEPAYLTYIVSELSRIYNLPEKEIVARTTYNAEQLFNI
ncbi:TatD family hydrolase [Bacteroidales bacterium OttesenSCG-928-M11]|nr:TatD family hydrolase [Bacteroidales bacterium OttesenSCG-928-M11]